MDHEIRSENSLATKNRAGQEAGLPEDGFQLLITSNSSALMHLICRSLSKTRMLEPVALLPCLTCDLLLLAGIRAQTIPDTRLSLGDMRLLVKPHDSATLFMPEVLGKQEF
jgi:hypothetical protein